MEQEELDLSDVPSLALGDYEECRAIGDDWYQRAETAVLWVPSIVSPHESNLLFNQQHKDFSKIIVHKPAPAHVDPRRQLKKKKSNWRCPPLSDGH